ncbi:MAG: hypothetical protein LBH25_09535 [Fibromonadaceae bacterium]|jgi:hypothetical protein|nr:hypothetical protein [Fibromonadaceae bacterium]
MTSMKIIIMKPSNRYATGTAAIPSPILAQSGSFLNAFLMPFNIENGGSAWSR